MGARYGRWGEAFAAIKAQTGKRAAFLAGDLASTEAIFAAKMLAESFGDATECRLDGAALPAGNRSAYVGTARIEDIDEADVIMLAGCNPRLEAPVLNARIRKAWSRGGHVGVLGEPVDLTYLRGRLRTGTAHFGKG
mgnify:CR=1 FL=1